MDGPVARDDRTEGAGVAKQDQLREEQSAVDRRYERLDTLREQTAERLRQVRRVGPSGSPQNRSERDAFATLYEDRMAQLDAVEQRLTFGRLDLTDGETLYIGRIGLTEPDHTVILTDWRAPAAQAFYRATAARPEGVVRRRHLVSRGRVVTGVEDEVLDMSAVGSGVADPSALSGEGALLAALAAGRTGRMGDIVATIQAEQDAIIRSELAGALVVQGGPGTGKTAVALHRAAYLLYAHRRTLERSGVLLVGPSRTFLRYIDQVLPSLGETGVVTATVADLLPGVVSDGVEPDDVAEIKGRPIWAQVLTRAVRQRQRVPQRATELSLDGTPLTIEPADIAEAAARARRAGRPHNLARVAFVRDMLVRLATQYSGQMPFPLPPDEMAEVVEDLRTMREVRIALNLAWMPMTPQRLVEGLLTRPERLRAAAPELSDAERAALHREPGAPWTAADVPLLDEAAELLGEDDQAERAQAAQDAQRRAADVEYARQVLTTSGTAGLVSAEVLADRFAHSGPSMTTAERAASDRTWTYGHVVVDEAQELSSMAWRMLLRRCPTRSMTIAGDVAQTSTSAGARSWRAMLDPVLRESWRLAELTVNYRTPAVVAQAAQDVAGAAGLPVSRLTSAREVPDALSVRTAGDLDAAAVAEVEAALVMLASVGPTGSLGSLDPPASSGPGTAVDLPVDDGGRVAVIAAPDRVDGLRHAISRSTAAPALRPAGTSMLDARVAVMSPRAAKGLEFDVVVLVEPNELAKASPGDLYVAMTRPTRALRVITSGDLPAAFPG
jgi:DNA helicase IV